MTELKISTGLWVFAGPVDRFATKGYRPPTSLREQVEMASKVEGIKGVECHQSDFEEVSPSEFKKWLDDLGLQCSNVNTNVWTDPKFALGAFSHPDEGIRRQAIDEGKRAVDIARETGAKSIGLWLGSDGFDYPFQVDYVGHWGRLIESIAEVADYAAPDVKVGIEYKVKEPRTHILISDAGKALSICLELGKENVGVTIDFGHALMCGESPAEALCFLARHGKLFNVHFNDAYGLWDDDMFVGSLRIWETMEFLYWARETGYEGWLGLDQFPFREDPVKAARMSVDMLRRLWELIDRIPKEEFERALREMDPCETHRILREVVFGR
ncbi:MAG TPA: hypothetical protein EYP65_05435 [Armatimonadetes bacterium]|nr:hypothetical protein [Armatimonadota bacterium]